MDNGRTLEGEAARTDPALQGTKLRLFSALRLYIDSEALKRWPQLTKRRFVTVSVETARKNAKGYTEIYAGLRVCKI